MKTPLWFHSRLLHQLLEKEREYQTILQQVLKEREQEIKLLRRRSESAGLKSLMACSSSTTDKPL